MKPKKKSRFIPTILNVEDKFKIADLYFKSDKYILYHHHRNSFDKFLDDDVRSLLADNDNIFYEKYTQDKIYRYKFEYSDISIKPALIDNLDEIMFPKDARDRNLTYASEIVATIKQIQEITNMTTDKVTRRIIGQPEYEYPVARIPIMVRSKYCSLNIKKGHDKYECPYDPGGYFIVNGSEKVIMSLERMQNNEPFVFIKKDSNSRIFKVMTISKLYGSSKMTQIITIKIKKDNILTIQVPILNEIPVFILFRALGIESDKDIINMIVYNDNDMDMKNLIRISLENSVAENTQIKIVEKEQALMYLINKMRVLQKHIKYSDVDLEVRMREKKIHLEKLLRDNFLPHIDSDVVHKAYYLGYMINKLLNCYLGRIPQDERDSYINKRIDAPGPLLFELFQQYYKKMLNNCSKFFDKRNNSDEHPLNIINQIKPNIIEQGLKGALLTGAWGHRKGVAQMLQRLTYMQTMASLRRINSPTVDPSTNKLTDPRHIHGTQIGYVCPVKSAGVVNKITASPCMKGNISKLREPLKTFNTNSIKEFIGGFRENLKIVII